MEELLNNNAYILLHIRNDCNYTHINRDFRNYIYIHASFTIYRITFINVFNNIEINMY